MPSTRRSARLASQESSPAKQESPKAAAGSKRKSETGASPSAKRGKKDVSKEQKTIEETMDIDQSTEEKQTSTEVKTFPREGNKKLEEQSSAPTDDNGQKDQATSSLPQDKSDNEKPPHQRTAQDDIKHEQKRPATASQQNGQSEEGPQTELDKDHTKQVQSSTTKDALDPKETSEEQVEKGADNQSDEKAEQKPDSSDRKQVEQKLDEKPSANGTAVQSHARDDEVPSSILEKGVIYFFFRGRVGIDNPSDVNDLQRSFIVLRALPHGAKLGDGTLGTSEHKCRLLALPKKTLPTSGKDRFMTFVEKGNTSFTELRKSFLPANDYTTQTAGVRHTPAATPIAEGIYAITTTGRESHLAYMLTIPADLGQVQMDIGLKAQGSFIVSCKNPQYPGPSYASLPQSPDFPKEVLDEFRSLRWMPLQPKHLDYANTQFLLIGESGGFDSATQGTDKGNGAQEETPKEEIEKLEGEDEIRVRHLKGDDAIFADLGVSKKDYPRVPTTWTEQN